MPNAAADAILYQDADMKNKAKKQKPYALTAILSALSCAIMLATYFFETASLSVAAIAAVSVIIILAEYGSSFALSSYFIISVISLLICPVKSAPIAFAAFFGIYPLIKRFAEARKKLWHIVLKCAAFIVAVSAYALSAMIFFPEEFTEQPIYYYIFVPLCAVAFLLYDKCLTLLMRAYAVKLRPKIAKYL